MGLLNEKMEPSLCHYSMTCETAPSVYAPVRLQWNWKFCASVASFVL